MQTRPFAVALSALLATSAICVSSVRAQDPTPANPPAAIGGKKNEKKPSAQAALLAQLNLTDEQKTKIKTIEDKAKADRKAARVDAALTADQKKDKTKEIGKDATKAILEVLTPEQQAKYKDLAKAAKKAKDKDGASAAATGVAPAKP